MVRVLGWFLLGVVLGGGAQEYFPMSRWQAMHLVCCCLSPIVIWAVLALIIIFSTYMHVSLLLWPSSCLAMFSASAGSNSSFTRVVSLFRATSCFSFTILLPYTLSVSCQSLCACHFVLRVHADCVCPVPRGAVLWLALA